MDSCFGCGKSSHKVQYCPFQTIKGTYCRQAQPRGSSLGSPKQNRLYALQTQKDREGSLEGDRYVKSISL